MRIIDLEIYIPTNRPPTASAAADTWLTHNTLVSMSLCSFSKWHCSFTALDWSDWIWLYGSMYKNGDKHATVAISVVQLCVQQAVVRTLFGLEIGGVSAPLSITRHCEEQRQMAGSTHTPSFSLSVHPSQSPPPALPAPPLKAWERQLLFTTTLKGPTKQTAANVTLWLCTFYLKPWALLSNMVPCGKPGNQRKTDRKNKEMLDLHKITKTKTHLNKQKD